ncbi:Intraflagellar transport protein -like protein [Halotydeus destructor]|nr:Intraflagellar transport protein -like protein [Halotydeus destructor]
MYLERRFRLLVLTESLDLHQYAMTEGGMTEVSKVRLSGVNRILGSEPVTLKLIDEIQGLIGMCITGERVIRVWQLETGQNATVIVAESSDNHWAGVNTVDYCRNVLVAGSSNNHVTVWKRSPVRTVAINKGGQVAVVTLTNELYLLEERKMCITSGGGMAAVQTGSKSVRFDWLFESKQSFNLDVMSPVKSIRLDDTGQCVAIGLTGSRDTSFFKLDQSSATSFRSQHLDVSQNMFVMQRFTVYGVVTKLTEGHMEQIILTVVDLESDSSAEKSILSDLTPTSFTLIGIDLIGNFLLVVFKVNNVVQYVVYSVIGLKVSAICEICTFVTKETIIDAKINCSGNMIAFQDQFKITVVKVDSGQEGEPGSFVTKEVGAMLWSSNEARLMAYSETGHINVVLCSEDGNGNVTARHYEQIDNVDSDRLMAFRVPDLHLLVANNTEVSMVTLSEFQDLTFDIIVIMLDFLTNPTNNLNAMIKTINKFGEDNKKLWNNLARISVKCRDLKMGLYCITKLRNARVANDVKREYQSTKSDNCALAILAINLNLYSEAEELLKTSGNQLALAKFYQNRNQWDKAIECVDKVNLKTIFYNYAKHLENEEANIQEAKKFYEKSNTHTFEVPRMLFDMEGNSMLQKYCTGSSGSTDKGKEQLLKWWGQYCESLGDVSEALKAYEKAKDYYHLVRLLCYTGELEKAKSVVSSHNDDGEGSERSESNRGSKDAALLHLGRHLESSNALESIGHYLSCGAIKHAIRVCQNNNLIDELAKIVTNYGTRSDARDLVVKYLSGDDVENDLNPESVVQLYHKAGNTSVAIEMAIKHRTWTQLRAILRNLVDEDEESLALIVTEQHVDQVLRALRNDSMIVDIVIDVLLLAKSERLTIMADLLSEYNVEINDELIEKVEKITSRSSKDNTVASSLAEMALQQGKYVIAAKLYNSLGDRTESIKALIRSGQTDKVVNYANIARDKTVFKIAANYLQTVSFGDHSVIASFYKKAGAKQELDRFLNS